MRKPLIHSLLLALVFMSSACGNAKFNGKGKKKDKKQADVVVVEPPVTCKPGETCVVPDPNCKEGDANCPTPNPTTTPTPTPTTTPVPPKDDCKGGSKDCPVVPPHDDCDDEPGQNPSQNHDDSGKDCPHQNDDAGQNDDPVQHK
ncbi:MAG TPA: hypothetical protein VFO10_00385 [Oligoflexus sp.]|uniref:hypothetical protein n=1 Tax=Oligoflexus sp. TaxID=1971216 RepID=UPI002D8074CA|nr:hypothetical protein [Oligoflexus sp.]HET9235672.1 hypothetical protein [Oligoflexus sp.]